MTTHATIGMDFPGPEGFLGTRASLMLDIVSCVMVAVVAVLAFSIHAARRGQFRLHKALNLTLAWLLLVAVAAFEVEVRCYGWQARATAVPGQAPSASVMTALYVHLFFAIWSTLLWPVVIVRATRGFSSPPGPGPHSRSHRLWGRVAAASMMTTAVTGWVFYCLAFL